MSDRLNGKKIAFLATDGVEQIELTEPWKKVQEEGGTPELVSIERERIQGFDHLDKADTFDVDVHVSDADQKDYDGLVLPGGVANPDFLRADGDAVRFVRTFFEAGKPVAAICHGPWTLVEADVVRGRTLTSFPEHPDGPAQRGRQLGRRGGPRRPGPRDEPQARRPPRVLRQARGGDLRGPPRAAGAQRGVADRGSISRSAG